MWLNPDIRQYDPIASLYEAKKVSSRFGINGRYLEQGGVGVSSSNIHC
jgi:hypothetical protein